MEPKRYHFPYSPDLEERNRQVREEVFRHLASLPGVTIQNSPANEVQIITNVGRGGRVAFTRITIETKF